MNRIVVLLLLITVINQSLNSQTIYLEDLNEICPNVITTYKVFARDFLGNKMQGDFHWSTYVNGVFNQRWSALFDQHTDGNGNIYIKIRRDYKGIFDFNC